LKMPILSSKALFAASLLSAFVAYFSMRYFLHDADYLGVLGYILAYQALSIVAVVLIAAIQILRKMRNPYLSYPEDKDPKQFYYNISQMVLLNTLACRVFLIEDPALTLVFILAFNFTVLAFLKYYQQQKIGA
jgi:hypothetical protein